MYLFVAVNVAVKFQIYRLYSFISTLLFHFKVDFVKIFEHKPEKSGLQLGAHLDYRKPDRGQSDGASSLVRWSPT